MKKLTGFLAIVFFAATLSLSAQEPKTTPKSEEKTECKMGKDCKMSCCSDKSKTDSKKSKTSKKKN
jgi:preprotein translocase subunit SecG